MEAAQWLRTTESLLKGTKVAPNDIVSLVRIQLKDVADYWWSFLYPEESTEIVSWEKFKEEFEKRFFSASARLELERRFIYLKQNKKFVNEYAAGFTRLSRYASSMVTTEMAKVDRFSEGLNDKLKMKLSPYKYQTYAEVVEAAIDQEKMQTDKNNLRTGGQKRSMEISSSQGRTLGQGQQRHAQPEQNRTVLNFTNCGKSGHTKNNCRRLHGKCLKC